MVKHNPKYAKVNLMNAAQAEESTDVIMGNLPVNDIPARVLFDTGASHCFISRPFASKHDLVTQVAETFGYCLPGPLNDFSSICSGCFYHIG